MRTASEPGGRRDRNSHWGCMRVAANPHIHPCDYFGPNSLKLALGLHACCSQPSHPSMRLFWLPAHVGANDWSSKEVPGVKHSYLLLDNDYVKARSEFRAEIDGLLCRGPKNRDPAWDAGFNATAFYGLYGG